MEVHKHPHHVTHAKKWGEYFLEFIMIFLAVTLGFFAENFREHLGDSKKEKEFITSLISDLKEDTIALTRNLRGWRRDNLITDSLLLYLKKEKTPINNKLLYQLIKADFFRFDQFKYNNHTIEELKSSGNFGLIKKRLIIDSVLNYDTDMKYLLALEMDVKDLMLTSKNLEYKIFDYGLLNRSDSNIIMSDSKELFQLLTKDNAIINELYNTIYSYSVLSIYHEDLTKKILTRAIHLLKLILHEYY
ncbi:MAG: hypothetical protein NVS3B19_14370 [Ginsengibacter sp.]